MKNKGKCETDIKHRQVKYLNNTLEVDHGKLKRLIHPARGFSSMKTAYATIKGFEVMRMFCKGQLKAWLRLPGVKGEVYLVTNLWNRQSDLLSGVLEIHTRGISSRMTWRSAQEFLSRDLVNLPTALFATGVNYPRIPETINGRLFLA